VGCSGLNIARIGESPLGPATAGPRRSQVTRGPLVFRDAEEVVLQYQELLAFGGGRAASLTSARAVARLGAPRLWEWRSQVRDALDTTRLLVYHGWMRRIAWMEVWQFTLVRRTRSSLGDLMRRYRHRASELQREHDRTHEALTARRHQLEQAIGSLSGMAAQTKAERNTWAKVQEGISRTATFGRELAVLCTELDRRRAGPLRI